MAIQRWEMLLSAQTDCYLLKIQGDRVDVDQILLAHPRSCQNAQEISGDVFQWVIFVVDAPLTERLAIQNQVMSLTLNTSGLKPSEELLTILDGLSGALQDLTNLTEEEQSFVMNKMAKMGNPVAPAPTPTAAPQNPIQSPGRSPLPPAVYPPAGSPLPRVAIPGRPGMPMPPRSPSVPAGPGPLTPSYPGAGIPLPSPGSLPAIVRPVQPPRSFPGAPPLPGTPMPSVPMPKISPVLPKPPKSEVPAAPEANTSPMPIPQIIPPLPKKSIPSPIQPPKKVETPSSAPLATPPTPSPDLSDLNSEIAAMAENAKTPTVEPLAFTPTEKEPVSPKPVTPPLSSSEEPTGVPAESPPPEVPVVPSPATKGEDGSVLRISLFFPTGQEPVMDRFLTTLIDVAQKKSKRPTAFQVALSVPTGVALENSTEWIWKAKTSGSDIFFVILPEGMGSELMDPIVGEAQAAGLRCFLVPHAEVTSKLLYMDLMVELMMFKRRIRPPA